MTAPEDTKRDSRSPWFGKALLAIGPALLVVATLFLWFQNASGSAWFDVQRWPTHSTPQGDTQAVDGVAADPRGVAVLRILLFATALLVAWNTALYVKDVYKAVERASEADGGRAWRRFCSIFGVLLLFSTLVWAATIYAVPQWLVGKTHEYIILFLFGSFAVIDVILGRNFRQLAENRRAQAIADSTEISNLSEDTSREWVLPKIKQEQELLDKHHREAAEYKIDEAYFRYQLLFVDIPVVIGIVLVIAFQAVLLDRADQSKQPSFAFLKGYATGSLVMHLVLSQVVFLIVSGMFLKRKQSLEDAEARSKPSW